MNRLDGVGRNAGSIFERFYKFSAIHNFPNQIGSSRLGILLSSLILVIGVGGLTTVLVRPLTATNSINAASFDASAVPQPVLSSLIDAGKNSAPPDNQTDSSSQPEQAKTNTHGSSARVTVNGETIVVPTNGSVTKTVSGNNGKTNVTVTVDGATNESNSSSNISINSTTSSYTYSSNSSFNSSH